MIKIPIGKEIETGQLKQIQDLDKTIHKGLKCNCICIGCGGQLQARMGEKRAHYFAHYRREDYKESCAETALHVLAKIIVEKNKKLFLPTYTEVITYRDELGEDVSASCEVFDSAIELIEPTAEKYLPDVNIKPDVLAQFRVFDDIYDLAIEFAVTHFVDEDKLQKVRASDLNTVEIDLSKLLFKVKEISPEVIEQFLNKRKNWKWLHISEELKSSVKKLADKRCTEKLNERNNGISLWCKQIRGYFLEQGTLKLPEYVYPEHVINPKIELHQVRSIPLKDISPPPRVGLNLKIQEISQLKDGCITFHLIYRDKTAALILKLGNSEWSEDKKKKSHLILLPHLNELPRPAIFERVIYWGYNERATNYVNETTERITSATKTYLAEQKLNRVADAEKKLKIYSEYFSGTKSAESNNFEKLRSRAKAYFIEMKRKGIPVDKIIHTVQDGWIFGCGDAWQVFVMYAMCEDSWAHAHASGVYKILLSQYGVAPLWPITELNYTKLELVKLGFDLSHLIDPQEVIEKYLEKLAMVRVLMNPVRGGYEKRFKCGQRFFEAKMEG